MNRRLATLAALCLFFPMGCSVFQTPEQQARQILDDAAEAMGGWEALRAVRAQRIVSEGSDWDPIQALEPGDTRHVNDFSSTLTVDFARPSARLEFRAQLHYPRERPESFDEIINGDLGMLQETGADGTVTQSRLHLSRLATRLRDLRRLPVRTLLTADAAPRLERLPDEAAEGVSLQVLKYEDSGQTVELRVDRSTHLPASVAYWEDDVIFGDTRNEYVWPDWRQAGEVMLPYAQELRMNGLTFRKESIQAISNNPSLSAESFAIPEEVRQEPEVGERRISQWPLRRVSMGVSYLNFTLPQAVEWEELAPGAAVAGGTSHETLVLEMNDHLMIVEAPLYEERSLAVIEAIQERFPGKPIRYAVVTHYHRDHSGGIRTYAAEGATVVAHSSILPFLREVLSNPKTIRPDALARATAQAGGTPAFELEGIDAMKEYTDGERVVRLYPVPNPHVNGMLGAYLPKERITFTADLVRPPAEGQGLDERARSYVDFVREYGLRVNRIGRVHGPSLPFRPIEAASRRQ